MYLGAIRVPVEDRRLRAAREWAAWASGRYGVKVEVAEGAIVIEPGPAASVDAVLKLKAMAEAVALGFSPADAALLENEGYGLEVVDLKEHVEDRHMRRVKGRIIGEGGKARRAMEELAGVKMVVGDRHVAILGPLERAQVARDAVLLLIRGRRHSTVYSYIRRRLP